MRRKASSQLIIHGTDSADPRQQAESHPYESNAVEPYRQPAPQLYSPKFGIYGSMRRNAQMVGGNSTFAGATTAAQSVAQSPLFYDYRWSTPDKFYFPRNRVIANSIWREVYKRDAVTAAVTDMYSEMPWSGFDLVGIEDSSIRKVYEDMFNALNLVPKLQNFTKDFMITGEVVLHTIFNTTKGIWERVIPHNPDYIRAEGIGLILDQPLLWLRPTPEIRRLLTSQDPRVRKLQQLIPKEILNAFRQNREIPLDDLNTTFIARLNNSTDIRGTSLYTRLFRITMYEDFIMNASLAVAQRNAVPLRLFKLGDPNSNWLPSQEDEAALAEMLSMAEADPLAAIIMHHNVSVEYVGASDRALLISKEWDFIERVKLLALGVAKSFLMGETSFSAAIAGLQTLMERLASLRARFEEQWIMKKLCESVAKMHDFYKKTEADLSHKLKIQHSDEPQMILPKLKWHKSLETGQDASMLGVWRDLKERGIVSDRTYAAGAGLDLDVERANALEEIEYKTENQPPVPPTPEMPNPTLPMPGGPAPAPPGASKHRASRKRNPYEKLEKIEAALEELADNNNLVDLQDALDAVDDVKREQAQEDAIEQSFANDVTGSPLLVGE